MQIETRNRIIAASFIILVVIVLPISFVFYVWNYLLVNTTEEAEITTELRFYPIEKSRFKKYEETDSVKELHMGERILVQNPPERKHDLVEMMLNYQNQKSMPIDSLCVLFTIHFSRYTSISKIYLMQSERRDGWGNTYRLRDEWEYNLGTIFVEPNLKKTGKWIVRVDIWWIEDDPRDSFSFPKITDSCATLIQGKLTLSPTGIEQLESINY